MNTRFPKKSFRLLNVVANPANVALAP